MRKPKKEFLQNIPQIRENELTETIKTQEQKQAIHQMENDKSPGIDGIPIEFYKESYVLFVKNLLQPYNNIFFIEEKSTKIKNQEIITLIPKKSNLNILR